jgi:hypothetical protein
MRDATGQPKVERELAAIVVADVVGYSRLMVTHEAGFVRLKRGISPPAKDMDCGRASARHRIWDRGRYDADLIHAKRIRSQGFDYGFNTL